MVSSLISRKVCFSYLFRSVFYLHILDVGFCQLHTFGYLRLKHVVFYMCVLKSVNHLTDLIVLKSFCFRVSGERIIHQHNLMNIYIGFELEL